MWVNQYRRRALPHHKGVLHKSDHSQLLVDAPTDAGTHDITHRSQTKRAAFDRAFHD